MASLHPPRSRGGSSQGTKSLSTDGELWCHPSASKEVVPSTAVLMSCSMGANTPPVGSVGGEHVSQVETVQKRELSLLSPVSLPFAATSPLPSPPQRSEQRRNSQTDQQCRLVVTTTTTTTSESKGSAPDTTPLLPREPVREESKDRLSCDMRDKAGIETHLTVPGVTSTTGGRVPMSQRFEAVPKPPSLDAAWSSISPKARGSTQPSPVVPVLSLLPHAAHLSCLPHGQTTHYSRATSPRPPIPAIPPPPSPAAASATTLKLRKAVFVNDAAEKFQSMFGRLEESLCSARSREQADSVDTEGESGDSPRAHSEDGGWGTSLPRVSNPQASSCLTYLQQGVPVLPKRNVFLQRKQEFAATYSGGSGESEDAAQLSRKSEGTALGSTPRLSCTANYRIAHLVHAADSGVEPPQGQRRLSAPPAVLRDGTGGGDSRDRTMARLHAPLPARAWSAAFPAPAAALLAIPSGGTSAISFPPTGPLLQGVTSTDGGTLSSGGHGPLGVVTKEGSGSCGAFAKGPACPPEGPRESAADLHHPNVALWSREQQAAISASPGAQTAVGSVPRVATPLADVQEASCSSESSEEETVRHLEFTRYYPVADGSSSTHPHDSNASQSTPPANSAFSNSVNQTSDRAGDAVRTPMTTAPQRQRPCSAQGRPSAVTGTPAVTSVKNGRASASPEPHHTEPRSQQSWRRDGPHRARGDAGFFSSSSSYQQQQHANLQEEGGQRSPAEHKQIPVSPSAYILERPIPRYGSQSTQSSSDGAGVVQERGDGLALSTSDPCGPGDSTLSSPQNISRRLSRSKLAQLPAPREGNGGIEASVFSPTSQFSGFTPKHSQQGLRQSIMSSLTFTMDPRLTSFPSSASSSLLF